MRRRAVGVALLLLFTAACSNPDGGSASTELPRLRASTIASGLTNPWDIGFTPDGTLLYTEKPGRIGAVVGGRTRVLVTLDDVFVTWNAGLLGLAVDPQFAANRRIYVCQSWTDGISRDVRLHAYTVDEAYRTAARVGPPLFSGAPAGMGNHNGCRPRFGPDGALWVTMGDAGTHTVPQDVESLGGKVLRIDKATGAGVSGNPNGSRMYTYGHRNVHGIVFRPGSDQVFAVEHGPEYDDEVTLLRPGGNGGWNPGPGYDEDVPMTDLAEFPDAMRPVWASGKDRLAPGGATFVTGRPWKGLDDALLLTCLAGTQVRALIFDAEARLLREAVVFDTDDRLRAAVQGPDGNLYVTTSNDKDDRILRLTPS